MDICKNYTFIHIDVRNEIICKGEIDMESRIEKAVELYKKGYNCSQAIVCTYADLVAADEEMMFRATEGLGAGMGNMEGTCGAVSGACVLAGLKNSTANMTKPNSKTSTYKLSREIMARFKSINTTTVCKELKGVDTGVLIRKCPDCIRDAAKIAEEVLFTDL